MTDPHLVYQDFMYAHLYRMLVCAVTNASQTRNEQINLVIVRNLLPSESQQNSGTAAAATRNRRFGFCASQNLVRATRISSCNKMTPRQAKTLKLRLQMRTSNF
jgi:hypothetical protein